MAASQPMLTFQQTILRLQEYWNDQGCALLQPIDIEVGAGTSHTATFLRAIGPEPWRAGYVQPSRRPKDARYGDNPNRLHQHHQYQVVLKPSPPERLALYLQGVDNVFDLAYTRWHANGRERTLSYGDVFHQNEVEQSTYNFEQSDPKILLGQFELFESEAARLIHAGLALPAYETVLKAGHTFNLLDARGAISVTERAGYIGRIRTLARAVAQSYFDSRERLGFPMLQRDGDGA